MTLRDSLRTVDLARAVGVSVQQVRNYEAQGLLPEVARSGSGYRLYTERHLAALKTARALVGGYGWLRVAAIAIACGCAINVKFSGLIFGPLAMVLLLARALYPKPWKIGAGWEITSRMQRVGVAIGIGVNVLAFPKDAGFPATSLKDLGADISAQDLFKSLSAAWARDLALWDEGRGLAVIRDRWLNRAAGLGGEVAVRLDGQVLRGTFDTIDEDCRFVIRLDDGRLTHIAAGDVHFGAVASASAS